MVFLQLVFELNNYGQAVNVASLILTLINFVNLN